MTACLGQEETSNESLSSIPNSLTKIFMKIYTCFEGELFMMEPAAPHSGNVSAMILENINI